MCVMGFGKRFGVTTRIATQKMADTFLEENFIEIITPGKQCQVKEAGY